MANLYLDADVDEDLADYLARFRHDGLTTAAVGRRRAGDEEQLAYAASVRRVLVTHNRKDYELLQRAWRHWPDVWSMDRRPTHDGILVVPQPPALSPLHAATEIDAILRSGRVLVNRLYRWKYGRGWTQDG